MKIDRLNNGFDRVTSDEGMWLFNGETFSKEIFTPKNADLSAWREVNNTFKEVWEKEHQPEELGA